MVVITTRGLVAKISRREPVYWQLIARLLKIFDLTASTHEDKSWP